MLQQIKKLLNLLLDNIYPPTCVSCNQPINNKDALCHDCWSQITFIKKPTCGKCGVPYPFDLFDEGCPACENEKFYFHNVISALKYDEITQKIIHDFKYHNRTIALNFITRLLAENLKDTIGDIDIITCIPMHKNKLIKRGFNQATIISKRIAQHFNKPHIQDLLIKRNDNSSQSGLNKKERKLNVKGVFCMNNKHDVRGKSILIIDDVITTCATVNECALILKQKNAHKVFAASFARTY